MIAGQPSEVEVSPDGLQVWSQFSHLGYNDFGRTENLEPWKLAKVFEAGRFHGMSRMDFLRSVTTRRYGYFVVGLHYEFNPDIWSVRRGLCFPFKVSFEVRNLGRTSLALCSKMVNKLDNKELASAICKIVYVDRATRRPVPFPDWIQEKFAGVIKKEKMVDFPRTAPEVPASAYVYDMTVVVSDTDINAHTNQASYVKYCSDAAQGAVAAGELSGFHGDIGLYPLTELQTVYMGESSTGDKLQVLLWQPPDCQEKIHFVIRRQGKDEQPVIFQAYMLFRMTRVAFVLPRL